MPNDNTGSYPPIVPSPVPPPDESADEVEEQPQETQEGESKTVWIGAPDAPKQAPDGLSDLFDPGTEDDTSDLVSVDIDKDIVDINPETGDLSDLTDVSEEDILGDEETGQVPLDYQPDPPRRKILPRYRRSSQRYVPPTRAGGSGS